MNINTLRNKVLIVIIASLLFVPFLGVVHLFDWDEINFAECAREMLVTHDYFSVKINFEPFWEKPPIFIWMQALSMNIIGVNEFAARLPNAICGIITLLVLFNIGKKIYNEKFGLIWSLVYASSILPHFYFKSGIIDPWFNLFIFSGLYYFISFSNYNSIATNPIIRNSSKNNKLLIFSAFFIGLAVLTKGPVAILVFGLCIGVYWITRRFQPILSFKQILIFVFSVSFVGSLWFLMLVITGNTAIIKEFFLYQVRLFNTQDAGHGGPFYYHWVVLLIGCFPLSIFALCAFNKNSYDTPFQKYFKWWMMILFWVVLILFSVVKTKIVHYSSLCYFPLSFLGAYGVHKLLNGEIQWKKRYSILLMSIATIVGVVLSALPFLEKNKQKIINANIIKDDFALGNLNASVYWSGFEWLIGFLLIIGVGVMLFFINQKKIKQGIIGIFVITLIVVNIASVVIAPRIEQYSQGAAIEFYEYLQNKDCYVETIGFKSYAHLFYSKKKKQLNNNSCNMDWLLKGAVDKPTYFVSKINSQEEITANYPQLKEIYRKNGFVFWIRISK